VFRLALGALAASCTMGTEFFPG